MFRPTEDIASPGGDRSVDKDATPDSKTAKKTGKEAPTPSQVGSFLHAMEKKEEPVKPRESVTKSRASTSDKKGMGGLFALVGTDEEKKNMKMESEDDFSDTSSGASQYVPLPQQISQSPTPSARDETTVKASKDIGLKDIGLADMRSSKFTPFTQKTPEELEAPKDLMPNQPVPLTIAMATSEPLRGDVHLGSSTYAKTEEMVKLIASLVDHITTIEAKDLTSTQIVLKNPPVFAGSTITINEYVAAKHQFNLVFHDLSPDARRLIESASNQAMLQDKLLEKGYMVRQVIIDPGIRLSETHGSSFEQSSKDSFGERSEDTPQKNKNRQTDI